MTESKRTIEGLTPRPRRQMDASSLTTKKVRPASPLQDQGPIAVEPAGAPKALIATNATISSNTTKSGETAPKEQISVYIPRELRSRARAAFQATSFVEDDEGWSHMIEKALLAEVIRRENTHNGGNQYAGKDRKLRPGRTLKS